MVLCVLRFPFIMGGRGIICTCRFSNPAFFVYFCRKKIQYDNYMNYEISGKLIFKEETQHISDRFQKREFVIEVENEKNPQWNDFVKVQLIQDRCDLLENISLDEHIKVYFNIRGRKWENKGQVSYFTNLEGWRIEKLGAQAPAGMPVPEYRVEDIPPEPEADDLPF